MGWELLFCAWDIEEVEAVVPGCSALVVGDCSGMRVVIWGTDEEVIVVDIWLYYHALSCC